jgi:hypothetical protein
VTRITYLAAPCAIGALGVCLLTMGWLAGLAG